MKFNIKNDCEVAVALEYASGTSTREGTIIDTAGFEGCAFVVQVATCAANSLGDCHVESGDNSALSDAADLAGTAQVIDASDDDQLRIIDVKRPLERYLRVVVTKDGSDAQAESAVAILYGAQNKSTTLDSDVEGEAFVSVAEGTK